MLIRPDRKAIEVVVGMALMEDAPWGDITSQSLLPAGVRISAQLVAREEGVLCGEDFKMARGLREHRPSTLGGRLSACQTVAQGG